MKKILRFIIRKMLGVREFETISDAFDRKKYKFLKKINQETFSTNDFEKKLIELGLKKGDTVIVHASWRAFIGYEGSPKDIIDSIIKIIGIDGTLLMPSFTINKNIFDYNDISSAGVIAEIFRKEYSSNRSLDSNFSMTAFGKNANDLLREHVRSVYCFDEFSPYSKAIQSNAKVLLLGLGRNPHKITLFHCITYELKNIVDCYTDVYTLKRSVILYDKDGNKIKKDIVDRQRKYQNNKRKFKKLFKMFVSKNNYSRLNKMDMYLFDSNNLYTSAKKYILNNNYNLYK